MHKNTSLKELSLFNGLKQNQLERFVPLLEDQTFSENEVIFEQGHPANYLYILVNGKVSVRFKPYDGPPLNVAVIMPGGVFGWSSAMGRSLYTSCAISLTKSKALMIKGEALQKLCLEDSDTGIIILNRLAGVISDRLDNTHNQILELLTKNRKCST